MSLLPEKEIGKIFQQIKQLRGENLRKEYGNSSTCTLSQMGVAFYPQKIHPRILGSSSVAHTKNNKIT